jgi:hypothetical protein
MTPFREIFCMYVGPDPWPCYECGKSVTHDEQRFTVTATHAFIIPAVVNLRSRLRRFLLRNEDVQGVLIVRRRKLRCARAGLDVVKGVLQSEI